MCGLNFKIINQEVVYVLHTQPIKMLYVLHAWPIVAYILHA